MAEITRITRYNFHLTLMNSTSRRRLSRLARIRGLTTIARSTAQLSLSTAKDVVAMLRDIFVVIGLLLFFVGYVYRYVYMRSLGVPVHATQSPVNELMVYSYTVFEREWPWILGYIAFVAA